MKAYVMYFKLQFKETDLINKCATLVCKIRLAE